MYNSPHCHVGFLFFLLHPASAAVPSSHHHQHNTINTTPSIHLHQHNTINTTPSIHHHQHNTINTTPSTLHHQKQHHQDNIINTPSTQHHQHYTIYTTSSKTTSSTQHHQHDTIKTTPSTQHHLHYIIKHNITSYFACQVQHSEHIQRGPRKSGDGLSNMGAGCVAGAALGGPQSHFAWQVQHSEHLQRGQRKGCFCVAGAALGACQCHFAWQVQHLEHLQSGPQKSGDDWVLWAPAAFGWQVRHLEHLSLIFAWPLPHGYASPEKSEAWMCACLDLDHVLLWTVLIESRIKLGLRLQVQHNQTWKPSATESASCDETRLGIGLLRSLLWHSIIYTTPSTQYHQHSIIYWVPSHFVGC